jgi:hypothetical protein
MADLHVAKHGDVERSLTAVSTRRSTEERGFWPMGSSPRAGTEPTSLSAAGLRGGTASLLRMIRSCPGSR